MKFIEWAQTNLLAPLVLACIGALGWLVRKILTNEKAIAVIQAEHNATREALDRLTTVQEGIAPVVERQTELLGVMVEEMKRGKDL